MPRLVACACDRIMVFYLVQGQEAEAVDTYQYSP
jgi:hypothetical protein